MSDSINYPVKMLRGISSFNSIKDGLVTSSAFQFDHFARQDGYRELSITWYENEEALDTIKKQKKDDESIQFKAGIAELDISDLKVALKPHFIRKTMRYEKSPTRTNKYHGNLLLKDGTDRELEKMIRAGLANNAGENIYPNEYYSENE